MIGSTLAGSLGAVLILLVLYDAIRTTLSASSAGPITNHLMNAVWLLLLRISRRYDSHALLAASGAWITVSLIVFWLFAAWLGWFLLFCGSPQAVVNSTSQVTADLFQRAYYAGYTLTTLGYGDYVPGNDAWRIPPALAAASGFFLFTLAITYILNIVSNVTQKRQVALAISALGQTPQRLLESTADEGTYQSLSNQLQQLQQSIGLVGQQHLAFPILHYYHAADSDKALPLALARLYQSLSLVCFACPEVDSTTRTQLKITQQVLDQFLDTLGRSFIRPAGEAPPIPELEAYAALPGVAKSAAELHDYLTSLERQKLLLAYVREDGWEWHDVWHATPGNDQP
ncbi:potassium channel family protein [Halomonas sp. HP20-15]|uniref:potassium channel family protein n=1 Tax=Halomonas sp. HP20-15 TaxID=3085901 RepID=UPI0029821FCD|nr:potassium channel family protein [Halomonas sp. HP20-15]MDW5376669.1 potassium channel family protein [Halomonas sp. HP20-15]